MANFFKNKKFRLTIILGILTVITGIISYNSGQRRQDINYPKELDSVIAEVEGKEISLRDFAFYAAYEEQVVEEEAYVYEPGNTSKYWNLHIDGEFVRIAARNSAVDMAIHDEIFYSMAVEDGITLDEEEQEFLANSQMDFLSDLSDYEGLEKLGVDEETICSSMEKVALAQKYQEIYAELNNKDVSDYDFNAKAYKALLAEKEYKINEDVLKRLVFGNITLGHRKEDRNGK
ncbi:MAG: hypothetical protein U0K86_12305 [Agathobacter sp.]|nr:hypothetical protein [Agathobacter sp.]